MNNPKDYNSKPNSFLYWLLSCALLVAFTAKGQLRVVPLSVPVATEGAEHSGMRVGATVNLPFFDDFSTATSGIPDATYWETGSGVSINNTLTTGQPSLNLATFDGLNSHGFPYNFINPLYQDFTDTLTSQPIALGGLSPADSIYLSFFWQSGSLIEKPDSSDFLQLEFLGVDAQWEVVWKQTGYRVDSAFHQTFVAIKDPKYLHSGFQFRFQSYGRSSGAYDMWHVDYVFLNAGRNSSDRYIRDLALTRPLSPLLKEFTNMPLGHYLTDPGRFTEEAVTAEIRNLYNNENRTSFVLTLEDELSGTSFVGGSEGSTYIGPLATLDKSVKMSPLTGVEGLESLRIRYKFMMQTTDNQNPSIPTIDLRRNDTLSAVAELNDYFAYDDGTAEYGVQMNQKLGRTVVQYLLPKPDTIGGVRMSILPFNNDIAGSSFTLQLWSNKQGKPDRLLAQQAFPATYNSSRTELSEFAFARAVAVSDTFYVGWLQVSDNPLTIGYDLNTKYGAGKVHYSVGNSWTVAANLRGSIMIRPFVARAGAEVITGTEPLLQQAFYYPNPFRGTVQWKGEALKKIEVYDQSGRLLREITDGIQGDFIDLKELTQGYYYFKTYTTKGSSVHRMLRLK
ncbi:putative secreted protein (Por secretion system target) [Dyadobacter jejuensis]|uniref:Putative secreted protein (Por secretion system target) n=1 Tax=Dyadobacter jejuensis TaxID=1082580 RepID=A0A316AA21_9BACT|nr:T9SS type A sorting domain-containing protein [Dyadobacter jejuensis]PWJ54513.1 putative secreted protein (Por secretion system target) [Dyadobacter jejuensis]